MLIPSVAGSARLQYSNLAFSCCHFKFTVGAVKATSHKARLTTGARLAAWQRIYLHIFRHLARKLLAGRMFRKAKLRSLLCKRASAQRRHFHTI